MADAARVNIGNRVAVGDPIGRVSRFKLGQRRDSLRRNAHCLEAALLAHVLAERTPRDNQGNGAGIFRAVDVSVDGNAVAHLDRGITVADDAGHRLIGVGIAGGGVDERRNHLALCAACGDFLGGHGTLALAVDNVKVALRPMLGLDDPSVRIRVVGRDTVKLRNFHNM